MNRHLFAIAVSLVLAGHAQAQKESVNRGRVPAWATASELLPVPNEASGAIFIRRQDFLVHLNVHGQERYLGYRIKILHANALQIGNLSLAWNPAAGTPTVHSVKVYRDGQAINILQSTSFEILRREDQLEAARLDGMLTAVLRVPDLRVGDEIEVEVTTPASDPSLGDKDAGVLLLAPNPAPGRYRLGLTWDEDQRPDLKIGAAMKSAATARDGGIDFRFDNPDALVSPKDSPPRYGWLRTVEFSDFADWTAVSRLFAPLYQKAAQLSKTSPIRIETARIAAANANPFDRARAALKLVQQDVRYIYIGLNGGNLTPATADQTWQRRYGDCKGKTALLLALLAELGIDAEPVLVNSSGVDDGFDERLPSPGLFDHVVVRAKIEGKQYWLDGTLPPVASLALTPTIPFKWVLPLSSQGRPIEQVAWMAPSAPDEVNLYEIDARAGFDKPAKITSTTIARGIKGLQAYFQFSSLSPAQILTGIRQELIGDTWQTIDDVQWRFDEKAAASVLTISGTRVVVWDDDDDGAKSLALPGGGFNPPEKRIRPADQDQAPPYYTKPEFVCHVTTVRLPTSTNAKQWSSKASYDMHMFGRNYQRAFELRDGAIRMIRGSRIELPEIDAATAKRDNDRIATFDNSMGYIFYNPSGQKMSVGTGQTVPATYERDWTAENVPCLSDGGLK